MATTFTPNANLGKPGIGDTGWGATLNQTIDAADAALGRVDLAALATGGAGTVGSPWTGWEAAIAAAPTDSLIFYRPGYYTQASSIVLGSTIRGLLGYGAKVTYTPGSGYAYAVADAAGNPGRRFISGLELTGNATAAGGINLGVTLEANWFGPWWLRDLFVYGFTAGTGIRTKYSGFHTLENCHCWSNDYGIYSETGSNAVTILNPSMNGNATAGIYASGCRSYNVIGGAVESSAQGIILLNGIYQLNGMWFEANTTRDVNIGASASPRITGNYFNSTATEAIAVTGLTTGWAARDNYYGGTYTRYLTDYWSTDTAYQYGKIDENRVNMATAYKDFFFNPYFTDAELSGLYTDGDGHWRTATKRGSQLVIGICGTADAGLTVRPLYGAFTRGSQFWYEIPAVSADSPPIGYPPGGICTVAGSEGTLSGVTGSINATEATLTVNDASDLYLGAYITIAGVSGVKVVIAISGTTVTLESAANATVTNAAVAFSAPTWQPMARLRS